MHKIELNCNICNFCRQFRDTAKERYFKNMNMALYFHSMIADYFLGIWGGGNPKPFKYTEIQRHRFNLTDKEGVADRKVPMQPLVFYNKDGKVSRYNLRKVNEIKNFFKKKMKSSFLSSLENYHSIWSDLGDLRICTKTFSSITNGYMLNYRVVHCKRF